MKYRQHQMHFPLVFLCKSETDKGRLCDILELIGRGNEEKSYPNVFSVAVQKKKMLTISIRFLDICCWEEM